MAVDFRNALVRVRDAIFPQPIAPQPPVKKYPLRARDFLLPRAGWPLVYVTDITGWSEEQHTGNVRFTLTHGMRFTGESASFQCMLPFEDGDLFGKRGSYLVIIMPTEDEAQVERVLREARRRPASPAP